MHKVIEPEAIAKTADLSAPHTVHCLPTGEIMISMLGDAKGDGPGGFLLLDDKFEIAGRWEKDATGMNFNYDFWYQPRHNVMVSSEWAAPKTFAARLQLRRREGRQVRPADALLGLEGAEDPPDDRPGRGGDPAGGALPPRPGEAARLRRRGARAARCGDSQPARQPAGGRRRRSVEVPPVKNDKFPGGAVPALISDFVLSMDDRFLYFSNWLHGDVRQYDISDPAKPKLTGHGEARRRRPADGEAEGQGADRRAADAAAEPRRQAAVRDQLALQHLGQPVLPGHRQAGVVAGADRLRHREGRLKLNEKFLVDFGKEPDGPSRAHEVRYPGGDCTSDIFS